MTRLPPLRPIASASLVVPLAACAGGQGPTQPDIEQQPGDEDAGFEEREPEDISPAPRPGQSPPNGLEQVDPETGG